jgi:hypothetical protein
MNLDRECGTELVSSSSSHSNYILIEPYRMFNRINKFHGEYGERCTRR